MISELDSLDVPRNKNIKLFVKHLAGQHDQRSHGGGGGIASPKDDQQAREKAVWEKHESGSTWEQVAKELGYANGGSARKAGMRHKERLDKEGGTTPTKPTPTSATTATPKVEPTPASGSPKEQFEQLKMEALRGYTSLEASLIDANDRDRSGKPTKAELEVVTKVTQAGEVAKAEIERRIAERLTPKTQQLRAGDEKLKVLKQERYDLKAERDKITEAEEKALRALDKKMLPIVAQRENVNVQDLELVFKISSTSVGYDRAVLNIAQNRTGVIGGEATRLYFQKLKRLRGEVHQASAEASLTDPKLLKLKSQRADVDRKLLLNQMEIEPLNRVSMEANKAFNREITEAVRQQVTKEVITELSGRTFGVQGVRVVAMDGNKGGPAIEEMLQNLVVTEMWEPSATYRKRVAQVKLKTATDDRGSWNLDGTMLLAKEQAPTKRKSTVIHELMHGQASMRPMISHAEFVFWHHRAKGEKVRSFKAIQGFGSTREKTVQDRWQNIYSGRVYNPSGKPKRTDFFEILSTGIQSVMFPSTMSVDREQQAFTLGMLMLG